MEKKPVYVSPKVSRLDEKESFLGQQQIADCASGTGAAGLCINGGAAQAQGAERRYLEYADGNTINACHAGTGPNEYDIG